MVAWRVAGGTLQPRFWPSLITLGFVVVMLVLGTWQLERRAWKHALIAQVAAAQNAAPLELPAALPEPVAAADFHKFTITGQFLHEHEIHLLGRSANGNLGYHILTPLLARNGQTFLVNRGWVPTALKDPASRQAGQLAGEQTVSGTLRQRPGRQWFHPHSEPEKNIWFYLDFPAMTALAKQEFLPPILLEADATPNPGGYPLGGQTRMEFSDNHLLYAIFWYVGALACLLIFGMSQWRRDTEAAEETANPV